MDDKKVLAQLLLTRVVCGEQQICVVKLRNDVPYVQLPQTVVPDGRTPTEAFTFLLRELNIGASPEWVKSQSILETETKRAKVATLIVSSTTSQTINPSGSREINWLSPMDVAYNASQSFLSLDDCQVIRNWFARLGGNSSEAQH